MVLPVNSVGQILDQSVSREFCGFHAYSLSMFLTINYGMKNAFTEGVSDLNRINMATRIADTAMDKFEEFIVAIAKAVARGSKALEYPMISEITMNQHGDLYADGEPIGSNTGDTAERKIDFKRGEIRIYDIAKRLTLYIETARRGSEGAYFSKSGGSPHIMISLVNLEENLGKARDMIAEGDAEMFAALVYEAIEQGSTGGIKWFKSTLIHEASHAVDLIANLDIDTYGKGKRKEAKTNPVISPALSKKIARIPKKEIRERIRKTNTAPGWFLKNYMGVSVADEKLNDWFDIMYTYGSKENPTKEEHDLMRINYMNRPTEISARLDEAISDSLTGILGAIEDVFEAATDSDDPVREAKEILDLYGFTFDIGMMVKHTMNKASLVKDITPENRRSVIKRLYYMFDIIANPIKKMLDGFNRDEIYDPRPELKKLFTDLSGHESVTKYNDDVINNPDINRSHKHTDLWYKHGSMFESEHGADLITAIKELSKRYAGSRGNDATLMPVVDDIMKTINPEDIAEISDPRARSYAKKLYVAGALLSGTPIENWDLAKEYAKGNVEMPTWFRSSFNDQKRVVEAFSWLTVHELDWAFIGHGADVFAALARASVKNSPETMKYKYKQYILKTEKPEVGRILIDAIRSSKTSGSFTMPGSGFGNTIHKTRRVDMKTEYPQNPRMKKAPEIETETKKFELVYKSDSTSVSKDEVHGNPVYHVSADGKNFHVNSSGNNDIVTYWALYFLIDDDIGALEAILSDAKMSIGVDGVPLKLLAGTAIPALMSEIGEESNILQIADMATRVVDPSNLHVLPEFIAEAALTLTRKLSKDGDYLIKIFTNMTDKLPDICSLLDIPITADIIDALSPGGDPISYWRQYAPRYLGADVEACNALVKKIENLEKTIAT